MSTTIQKFPKHSIGEHIIPFDLTFYLKESVSSVIKRIEKEPSSWPNIKQLFVVDEKGKLLGTVEFARLLQSQPNTRLKDLIEKDFTSATERSHQSNVAKIALKMGVVTIPVVDEEKHFVGIIDAGQILKILHEEHVDELMKFSGILSSEEFVGARKISLVKMIKNRLPWLIVGLFGGVIAAHIIGIFEKTLEAQIILASFIPLIVYMADAIGTQTETIFVRDLAVEPNLKLRKFLLKEITVGLTIAIICGFLIGLYSLGRFGSVNLGIILSLSLFSATFIAIIVGTFIPWFISRLKKDPALGTGPLTTVLQDVASVTTYFIIASLLL